MGNPPSEVSHRTWRSRSLEDGALGLIWTLALPLPPVILELGDTARVHSIPGRIVCKAASELLQSRRRESSPKTANAIKERGSFTLWISPDRSSRLNDKRPSAARLYLSQVSEAAIPGFRQLVLLTTLSLRKKGSCHLTFSYINVVLNPKSGGACFWERHFHSCRLDFDGPGAINRRPTHWETAHTFPIDRHCLCCFCTGYGVVNPSIQLRNPLALRRRLDIKHYTDSSWRFMIPFWMLLLRRPQTLHSWWTRCFRVAI
jgi:hypothetical protein